MTLSTSEEDFEASNRPNTKMWVKKTLDNHLWKYPLKKNLIPKPYNFRAKCEYCGVPLVWCTIRQRQPTQRLIEYLNFGSTSTSCKLTSFNEALTNENISINENKQWMKNTNFYFYYKIIPGHQWRCLQIKISWLYVGLQNEI